MVLQGVVLARVRYRGGVVSRCLRFGGEVFIVARHGIVVVDMSLRHEVCRFRRCGDELKDSLQRLLTDAGVLSRTAHEDHVMCQGTDEVDASGCLVSEMVSACSPV